MGGDQEFRIGRIADNDVKAPYLVFLYTLRVAKIAGILPYRFPECSFLRGIAANGKLLRNVHRFVDHVHTPWRRVMDVAPYDS